MQSTGSKPFHCLRLAACWIDRVCLILLITLLFGCQDGATPIASIDLAQSDSLTPISTPEPSVTVALLGDVMLGRAIHPSSETFRYLKPFLASADIVLANLESPLTNAPAEAESGYMLCAPPGRVKYLAEAGFDLMTLSNNHNLDCGARGLIETQSTLTSAGLGFIGPAPEPVYRVIHGIKLAFLAFDATTEFHNQTALQAIRTAREKGFIVVTSIHWGAEYQAGASLDQEQVAVQLAGAGTAVIWGHHPHVLQQAEWIHDGKTLVLYSLGNALFDQYGLENTRQSALVLVTVTANGVQGFKVIPFLIDVRNSRIVEADEGNAAAILRYFK
ncbi:MAG TPA: CapA family protein [Anaerolineales bacterium]|nr:CapA family protein [Anaerolineales bacterium]